MAIKLLIRGPDRGPDGTIGNRVPGAGESQNVTKAFHYFVGMLGGDGRMSVWRARWQAARRSGAACAIGKSKSHRTRLTGVFALLLSLSLAVGDAAAVTEANDPPIYNPASKSYFQLLKNTGKYGFWREALQQARARVFKGVRGRLAVVDTPETHEFIMEQFNVSSPIWIGLRYWCSFRMLEWVGLRPYSPTDPGTFQQWHPQWYRNEKTKCSSDHRGLDNYMPVYYQPVGKNSARWQASGPSKGFGFFLVEFPTGKE